MECRTQQVVGAPDAKDALGLPCPIKIQYGDMVVSISSED